MIYLRNITDTQDLYIPRHGDTPRVDLSLTVFSTVDLEQKASLNVEDTGTSDLYYNIGISLPDGLPDGEYEYILYSGDSPVASGLLMVGDFGKPQELETEIKYEQYETE